MRNSLNCLSVFYQHDSGRRSVMKENLLLAVLPREDGL
jgi:hypothetical protein